MFTVTGTLNDGREALISWYALGDRRSLRGLGVDRGLDGERDLIMRAIIDEVEGRTFRAAARPTRITSSSGAHRS